MKRTLVLLLALCFTAPAALAQDDDRNSGQFGAFLNVTRLKHADTTFLGFGARAGFNVHPNVQLEGEFAYDFEKSQTNAVTVGGVTTTQRSDLRMLHLMFGPKFQTTGPVRVFGTVKGGLLNFHVNRTGGIISGNPSPFTLVNDGDNNGVLYPAAGIEAYAGWFGIRAEVGDEIYFDRGANHNLRITIGPQIRW